MLVSFIESIEKIQLPNFSCQVSKAYFLLINDAGFITNSTSNFTEKYIKENESVYEDHKLSIDDIFMGLNDTSQTELKSGFKT